MQLIPTKAHGYVSIPYCGEESSEESESTSELEQATPQVSAGESSTLLAAKTYEYDQVYL